jgi:hypothetical protein
MVWEYWDVDVNNISEMCGTMAQGQDDYHGNISATVVGILYQCWDSQESHHSHSRTCDNNPFSALDENFCRNSDGEAWSWCYTKDTTIHWWFCDVRACDQTNTLAPGKLFFNCTKSQCGWTCQWWDSQEPHKNYYNTPELNPDAGLEANNY